MVISKITVIKNDKTITLAADITFRGKNAQQAYFTIDREYESFVATDASPFLAAVLLPCMKTRENIYVDGSVSTKLLENTNEIMALVRKWDVGLYKIKVRCRKTVEDTEKPNAVGSFFTAGVDSFYTYIKHKTSKNKITHLIMAHGFDIPLQNKSFFEEVKKTVEKVAKDEGVIAITLETNIGAIVEQRLVWDFSHGGALAAVALFLRRGFKQIFIPGAVKNSQLFPYGTHPDLDKLWSTKTLQVRNDGGEYDRIEKITKAIYKSPLALKYLRVCTQNIKGKYNCSRCYKCLITMIYLVCADSLRKSKTFDTRIDVNLVKKMYFDYKLKYNIQGEMGLAMLRRQHRERELQNAITYSLEKSKKPRMIKRVYQTVAQWDQKHNDRRLYQFVFRMNDNEDRNAFFKFLFKRGILK